MAGGRPSKYKPEFADAAATLCAQGCTDANLADRFGVSLTTIKAWKGEHPEFLAALKAGKAACDDHVERSLYQRAMGYECDEVDIRVVNGEIVETPIRKIYPPDTTAMIFWLKNRRPKDWRDKQEIEHSGSLTLADTLRAARERRSKR